jgi:hypothetical protein
MNDRDRFDKFTERARKVLSLAQEEAQRFNHNYIGTEHILLGLVREGEGIAAKVLNNLGVDLNKVRSSVEFIIGRGDRIVLGEIGLTPRAKKVIELAVDEARLLNHHYIGTEHLLLGLVREGEGIAAGALESLGVNLEQVRTQTIQVLSQASGPYHRSTSAASSSIPAATSTSSAGIEREPRLAPYKNVHITSEALDKTAIGKRAQGATSYVTMLGWVTVNTGGAFTLTLYQGMAENAPKIAVITNPTPGAYFPFQCLLEEGLAYTLSGEGGSITIVYSDILTE